VLSRDINEFTIYQSEQKLSEDENSLSVQTDFLSSVSAHLDCQQPQHRTLLLSDSINSPGVKQYRASLILANSKKAYEVHPALLVQNTLLDSLVKFGFPTETTRRNLNTTHPNSQG